MLRVPEAGPALRELYEQNRRKEWGLKVLEALSRIADPAQADLFLQLVQDPDPERKRLAVEGLGRISDSSRLPAFKKDYQRERNDDVRLAYAFAITLMGDRAFLDSLVLSLPSRVGDRCRGYILEAGRPILPDLYPYLSDSDAGVRAARLRHRRRAGRSGRDPAPATPRQRSERERGRPRQPGDRALAPGRSVSMNVRAACLLLLSVTLAAACTKDAAEPSAAPAPIGPVAEGRTLLEQGQLDAALARLQDAAGDPEGIYLQGRVWAKKAETAPLPTPPPVESPLPRGATPPGAPEFKDEEIRALAAYEKAIAARPELGGGASGGGGAAGAARHPPPRPPAVGPRAAGASPRQGRPTGAGGRQHEQRRHRVRRRPDRGGVPGGVPFAPGRARGR